MGRTCTNRKTVFDDVAAGSAVAEPLKPGDYVAVRVHGCTTGTLLARPLAGVTTVAEFVATYGSTTPTITLGAGDMLERARLPLVTRTCHQYSAAAMSSNVSR
jgi:hypothetical protein